MVMGRWKLKILLEMTTLQRKTWKRSWPTQNLKKKIWNCSGKTFCTLFTTTNPFLLNNKLRSVLSFHRDQAQTKLCKLCWAGLLGSSHSTLLRWKIIGSAKRWCLRSLILHISTSLLRKQGEEKGSFLRLWTFSTQKRQKYKLEWTPLKRSNWKPWFKS